MGLPKEECWSRAIVQWPETPRYCYYCCAKTAADAEGFKGFSVVRNATQFSIAAISAKDGIGENTSSNAKIYFKRAIENDHFWEELCGNPKALSDRAVTY